MSRFLLMGGCLLILSCSSNPQESVLGVSYDVTSAYDVVDIEGYGVYFSSKVERKAELLDRLNHQIDTIKRTIPADKFELLKDTKIWVENDVPSDVYIDAFVVFNWGLEWLTESNVNPDKMDSIEIQNVDNYLKWTVEGNQPSALFHEFAHALFNRSSKINKAKILDAFTKMMKSDLYKKVQRFDRKNREDAFAREDEWEYFAELTEAYYGNNDYFPNNRKQLFEYDPEGYALVKYIWEDYF